MRVLVTGSSGFIGRHLVRRLRAEGQDVVGLDRSPAQEPALGDREVICDLLDRSALIEAIAKVRPEAVMHLAARTDLEETRDLAGYAANMRGVDNLVRAIAAVGTVRRTIFTSTQLVCKLGYVPTRDDDYAPDTLYGESKVWTERIVRDSQGGGTIWCVVRPTTVWGPGMRDHYQRFIRLVASGRYFHVGHRPLFKSFGYVGNVVYQYARLLTAGDAVVARRTFYVADYEPLSLRQWADDIQQALGAPPVRSVPEPVARAGALLGDALNALGWSTFPYTSFRLHNVLTEYIFDMTVTKGICGPLPFTVADGVRETVAWFRSLSPARAR